MNTFLNIAWEFPAGHPDRADYIARNLAGMSLTERIYLRGQAEQYRAQMHNHYHPGLYRRLSRSFIDGIKYYTGRAGYRRLLQSLK